MAKELKQAVVQYDVNGLPERMIVQYTDNTTNEDGQEVFNLTDLDGSDTQTFNDFKSMAEQQIANT